MIKAIIFDFAGVVVTDGYWIWLKETLPNLQKKKDYYQYLAEQVDSGKITNKEFIHFLSQATSINDNDIWPQIRRKIILNKDLIKLIDVLRKRYKIGLLTNYTYEWFEQLSKDFNLSEYFDQIIISSKMKLIKPDPKIFFLMLSSLKINPDEGIYIDDREYQVNIARKIGLKSIVYTSTNQLKIELLKTRS